MPNLIEKEIGSDPYNPDTDGDGLPDGYEALTLGTDPTKPDTDDNGVLDCDEDFDEDGLTNLQEYEHGTEPISFSIRLGRPSSSVSARYCQSSNVQLSSSDSVPTSSAHELL